MLTVLLLALLIALAYAVARASVDYLTYDERPYEADDDEYDEEVA